MSIFGHHSVGELRDWLVDIDYQVAQIDAAHAAFASAWQARDASAHHDWIADWKALQTRYAAAHARAQVAILRSKLDVGIADSLIPVEDEWQGVLHSLTKTQGTTTKGDFQDLYNRLVAAQGKPIDLSKMPQPTAPDADLTAFQNVDAAIRAGETAARELSRQITPSKGTAAVVVVGLGLALGLLLATKSVLR